MEPKPKNLTGNEQKAGILLASLAAMTLEETPSEEDFLDLADWLEENPDAVPHLDQDDILVLTTILRNEDPSQLG